MEELYDKTNVETLLHNSNDIPPNSSQILELRLAAKPSSSTVITSATYTELSAFDKDFNVNVLIRIR